MRRLQANQVGLTLVEVMIALTLGLLLIFAITGIVIQSKATQAIQVNLGLMQDTASFALDNLTRNSKQVSYVEYDKPDAPFIVSDNMSSNIMGFDAKSLKAKTANISQLVTSNNNSSDLLALRFFGAGKIANNTVLNCAGFGEAEPASQQDAEEGRGWSIYYVADDTGEPALFCKFRGKNSTNYEAYSIARGVESFQVLYGIDSASPANGITTQFLTATQITALDQAIPATEFNKNTHWKKITAIKVALLIQGNKNSRADNKLLIHHLFGKAYSDQNGAKDPGSTINEALLSKSEQSRLRKVYSTTIQLRNVGNL
jgi:type IV pilus assembly protein PilW